MEGLRDRAVTLLATAALLAAGFLAGSFWLGWRGTPLEPAGSDGAATRPATVPESWGSRIRVEVLNGMGAPGAAGRASERLREMGFDVVYFGNADRFDHDTTRVLRRSTDVAAARRVADSMGVARPTERPDPELYLDATVILGEDWRRRMRSRGDGDEGAGEGGRVESLLEEVRERLGL